MINQQLSKLSPHEYPEKEKGKRKILLPNSIKISVFYL